MEKIHEINIQKMAGGSTIKLVLGYENVTKIFFFFNQWKINGGGGVQKIDPGMSLLCCKKRFLGKVSQSKNLGILLLA